MKKFYILPFLFVLFSLTTLQATHNRAGEITFKQLGALTFEVTITTYTKTSSVPADRDSLEIEWGDGTSEWIKRDVEVPLANDIKFNQYIATHTFPGQSTYILSVTDPNRNAGILNVNPPASDQVPFHLVTELKILSQFVGANNSPLLLQPPIDIGYTNQIFIHNPNVFDEEGDSIAYHFTTPFQGPGTPIEVYLNPLQVAGNNGFQLTLSETTGDLKWITPQTPGEYNVAFWIVEYRNGQEISRIIRDMQITIKEGDNLPPKIETIQDTCIIAGQSLDFEVIATDPDIPAQQVELTALGGPLQLDFEPAVFDVPVGFNDQPVTGRFTWDTKCEHILNNYYSVVFKARDFFETDDNGEPIGLSTLRTLRIKVVGPPPEDLQAEVGNGVVDLSWEKPYFCEDVMDNFFIGFSVYRREGSSPFPIDTCNPGLDGYTLIADYTTDFQVENNRYTFEDADLERGRFYCYRVVANFAQNQQVGNEVIYYNFIESLASNEICVQLNRDIPLMSLADVVTTDVSNGIIDVAWIKPSVEDLDTLQNPGPYVYKLYRSDGFSPGNPTLIYTSPASPTFSGANDTTFTDTGLNTLAGPYNYYVEFFVANDVSLGENSEASSIFLSIASTDNTNILNWAENVPWSNKEFIVYRLNENTSMFDSIGVTPFYTFSDEGLVNGKEYCYYVKGFGEFSIPELPQIIINRSQEACGVPIDTIPPCPPQQGFDVENQCSTAGDQVPQSDFLNILTWQNPNIECPDTDDVISYNIYFAPTEGGEFTQVGSVEGPTNTSFFHALENSIAGCYAVTSVDSFANESVFSEIICVDNCPIYTLPNVFTPNGDGANDLFIPFPYRFIESIDIKIYNRWGGLVYQTQDPNINWEGKNLQDQDLAEGVYYYICQVVERRLSGPVAQEEILNGYIHLIRGK